MKRKLLSILLIGFLVVGLTGCGSSGKGDSRFNYIIDELNTAVSEVYERNNDQQISVARIEERLTQDISSARIIACGDSAFNKDVDLTQTTYQKKLNGYNGTIISNSTKITKNSNVNYCLVMATNARGYLNITISYENIDNDTYKPVFSIPELLNE